MDKKIKVLLVSPYSKNRVGGIGTWTKSVLDFCIFDKETDIVFQNTAFELKRLIKDSVVKRLIIGGIDSVIILVKLFFNMLIYSPDVVHYTSSAGFGLLKDRIAVFIVKTIFKKKFVIHWHFGRIPDMYSRYNREYQRLRKVHEKSDASIVLDVRSKEAMIADKLANVYIVPNAVTNNVLTFAKSLNIKKIQKQRSDKEVLYVGHILPTKGIFELVKACSQINDLHLTVVGPDMNEIIPKLKEIAKVRDNGNWITFTGELNREKVLAYYQTCSVFCLPSYSEGFPYVILESMSCGCPIIATKVGAIPEMLSGGCGLVINPKDINELKSGIIKLINDKTLSIDMGNRAYNKVLQDYSINTVYNAYKSIWRQVL